MQAMMQWAKPSPAELAKRRANAVRAASNKAAAARKRAANNAAAAAARKRAANNAATATRRPSLTALIAAANQAERNLVAGKTTQKNFINKRNAVVRELSRKNRSPQAQSILNQIKANAGNILFGRNLVLGRMLRWNQMFAANMKPKGRLPPLGTPAKLTPPPSWTYKPPPAGLPKNTAKLALLLAAKGL